MIFVREKGLMLMYYMLHFVVWDLVMFGKDENSVDVYCVHLFGILSFGFSFSLMSDWDDEVVWC